MAQHGQPSGHCQIEHRIHPLQPQTRREPPNDCHAGRRAEHADAAHHAQQRGVSASQLLQVGLPVDLQIPQRRSQHHAADKQHNQLPVGCQHPPATLRFACGVGNGRIGRDTRRRYERPQT